MAYYTALINAWNSATQPPVGVTGTALTGLTTANKLVAINGWTVPGVAQKAILNPSEILNAIVFADLAALTQLQVSQLTLLLAGTSIDASPGTSIRLGIQALFVGKTTTLANLGALVAPFDSPTLPWWKAMVAQGGGALNSPVNANDLTAAGNLV